MNPIKPKGVETMIDIVDHFRDEQFEILEGWYPIERHYKEKIEKYSNVTITKHSNDMRKIYDRTKILLVPSICNEGFGRVIIEANINEIPVIASDVGGIKEAIGEKQILIKDYMNSQAFVQALEGLLSSKTLFKKLQGHALENSYRFSKSNLLDILF